MVANLNKICETVQWYADLLDEGTVIQKELVCRWGDILSSLVKIMITRKRECFANYVKCIICQS